MKKILLITVIIILYNSSFAQNENGINVFSDKLEIYEIDQRFKMKAGELTDGEIEMDLYFRFPEDVGFDTIYYKNENILRIASLQNGELNGITTYYYLNGNKAIEINFKNDTINGSYVEWYENKNVKRQRYFVDGKQTCFTQAWFENGKKEYDIIFDKIKNVLGKEALDGLHCHFSE